MYISLDPIKQTVLTEIHIMQSNTVCNGSGGGVEIVHRNAFRFKDQNILTSRALFANHLARIAILNKNNNSTARVCVGWGGGRSIALLIN